MKTSNPFDVTAHIQVTNPDRPERGTVRDSDLGVIEWDYRTATTPARCTTALAATIVPVLRDAISTRTI